MIKKLLACAMFVMMAARDASAHLTESLHPHPHEMVWELDRVFMGALLLSAAAGLIILARRHLSGPRKSYVYFRSIK